MLFRLFNSVEITLYWILNLLCLALTLVNVRNNVNETCKDVSAKQLRPSSVFFKSRLSDGFITVQSCTRATPARHNERLLRVITWGICKHPGYQYVRFPRCCLLESTKPRGKVSRENYEPCPQSSHGRSLYYGQTGSRVAQLLNCCLQPFGYFHCYLKMDAPRALVFRPLVKGNEALRTRYCVTSPKSVCAGGYVLGGHTTVI